MSKIELYNVLLDMPDMFKKDIFSETEKKEILKKYLFHRHAFSSWKKYYVKKYYGNLIISLEKIAHKKKASSFLEIGCGTASTSLYLAGKNYMSYCRGIDLEKIRINIAKKRAVWHGVDNCDMINCSALEMPEDQKFDLVYSMFAFELIKPLEPLLRKTEKVLSERGDVVLDMDNPMLYNGQKRQEKEQSISRMIDFFKSKDFEVSIEYHSILTGLDITGLLKKGKQINKCIRLHFFRT
ncbi:MAG: class I SAM-dependent methyltransferase [Cyclobacteriaceae bacterium]|nr:class I SAM-dependent methyltransferase [Cyclobacteriaceae bacterium]